LKVSVLPEHDPGNTLTFNQTPIVQRTENPMFIKTKPIQALTTGRLMENSPKSTRFSSKNRSIREAVRLCEVVKVDSSNEA